MPLKPASRLNEPTAKDCLWFNELTKKASDFFTEPSFYSDQFTFQDGKAIYPPDPERITHQKAKLIRKHGRPHPSIWINRVDLFAIHLEGDGWERLYTANLAGIDRAGHLTAQEMTRERTPEGATVEGQTYWELAAVLASDLLTQHDADIALVSPFLHHLGTGDLTPLNPLGSGEPLFTREKKKPPLGYHERQFMHRQSRLQEHDRLLVSLDKYGFIVE